MAARATTTFNQKLLNLKKFDLLILDDWGIEAFNKWSQNDLLELVDSQIGKRSVLFTSQFPLNVWHDAFDQKTVADAFVNMYFFETVCTIQVRAMAGGSELHHIPAEIIATAQEQARAVTRGVGAGGLSWPGLLRRLDRIDPSYRS